MKVLYHFVTKMPIKFEVATGKAKLCAVLIEAEVQNGKALSIQRVEKEGEIS